MPFGDKDDPDGRMRVPFSCASRTSVSSSSWVSGSSVCFTRTLRVPDQFVIVCNGGRAGGSAGGIRFGGSGVGSVRGAVRSSHRVVVLADVLGRALIEHWANNGGREDRDGESPECAENVLPIEMRLLLGSGLLLRAASYREMVSMKIIHETRRGSFTFI